MVGKKHITGGLLLVNNLKQHDLKCRFPTTFANEVNEKGVIGMSGVCEKKMPSFSFPRNFNLECLCWDLVQPVVKHH